MMGEGEVPVAFVLAEEGRVPRFLETRIARYKIPARYYFVAPLPLTRGGKIDPEALRTKAVAGKVR